MKQMRGFCVQRTEERVKLGNASRKDLFYYLVGNPPLLIVQGEYSFGCRTARMAWSRRRLSLR